MHNDLGCSAVNNAKALVYLADPAALSVQWGPVTMGQYVGDNGGSTGVSVPAGGQALIGPLPFTAPTSGIGDGHRCILAAIKADGEPAPAKPQDAPDSNQVGQRNVEFASPCVFPLTNGTSQDGSAQITLTATPNTGAAPSLTALPDIEVAFDDFDSSWFNAWKTQSGAGTTFKVTHSGPVTTIRLGDFSVALNPVPLPAGQSRNATGTTVLPSGYPTAAHPADRCDPDGNKWQRNGDGAERRLLRHRATPGDQVARRAGRRVASIVSSGLPCGDERLGQNADLYPLTIARASGRFS